MRAQSRIHALMINPVIYAEISLSFSTMEALNKVIETLALEVHEIPRPALFLAGKAFAEYRRRDGARLQVLPDFFIGAHAAVEGWPLLTRDAKRFRTYIRGLELLAPLAVFRSSSHVWLRSKSEAENWHVEFQP